MKSTEQQFSTISLTPAFRCRCIASWVAINDPSLNQISLTQELLNSLVTQQQELVQQWQQLHALRTLRAFVRRSAMFTPAEEASSLPLRVQGQEVWWATTHLGSCVVLYRSPFPQELQAKLAYETLISRYLVWLGRWYGSVVLDQTDGVVVIFVPSRQQDQGHMLLDFDAFWQRFIAFVFSVPELLRTFVLLLNSVTLADRGFSVPDIPIVTTDQVDVLLAFFYTNIHAIEQRLRRLEKRCQAFQSATTLSSKDDGQWQKAADSLAKQHSMYDQALGAFRTVCTTFQEQDAERFARILELSHVFTQQSTQQLKVTSAVVGKVVDRMHALLQVTAEDFFVLPPLLAPEAPLMKMRHAGDDVKNTCYVCGRVLAIRDRKKKRLSYTANKLVLAAPSQTLQNRQTQVQPEICPVCAALAMLSPIKTGATGLVISLIDGQASSDSRYLYDQQLRMLTTGELNMIAGRYLLLSCTESAPDGKPLISRLGGKEYALLKVASIFPLDVLARFQVEAFFGTSTLRLERRHLMLLSLFLEIFSLRLEAFRQEKEKARYMAVADAIRYIEHDMVIFALYRLVNGALTQDTFSAQQSTQLEDGLSLYKEQLRMLDNQKLYPRFCDIAGLTGILFAFVSYARSKYSQQGSNGSSVPVTNTKDRNRELKKLLEEIDNPNQFTYEAAGILYEAGKSQILQARLWRSQQNHFMYDEARRLLQEIIPTEVASREEHSEKDELALSFNFDDICKVYAFLYGTRYTTEKAQRDFSYELKLSLYSRFPELRPGNQK